MTHSGKKVFNHIHSSLRNTNEKCSDILKTRFSILKRIAPRTLCRPKVPILVAVEMLHTISSKKVREIPYLRMCSNKEKIVIDSDNEDKDDRMLTGFMQLHLDSEINSFR